jgi:hypothetical protein
MTILCHYAECHYAKCQILLNVMLNVVMLSVIMLNVIMLSVVAPNELQHFKLNISWQDLTRKHQTGNINRRGRLGTVNLLTKVVWRE